MSLLEKTALPYQAPYFSQIKSEDFAPALLEAMALQQQAITAIVQQTAPPSFDNTVLSLEKSGEALLRVANLFLPLQELILMKYCNKPKKRSYPYWRPMKIASISMTSFLSV